MNGRTFAVCALLLAAAACSGNPGTAAQQAAPAARYDDSALPSGQLGSLIRYGRALIMQTRKYAGPYVTANMDCAACHLDGGTKARAGSFVGIAATFPQWNKRAHRIIALQDRLAECFLYSMNGRPPAYQSREMEAMTAYITYLSRGAKLGSKPDRRAVMASISFPKADLKAGARTYASRCALCHGASGQGSAVYPPLWGSKSFNDGAGMHRVRTMAGFVRYNMPANAPGTLTDRQAFDVASWVLTHRRPAFARSRAITFPSNPASYF